MKRIDPVRLLLFASYDLSATSEEEEKKRSERRTRTHTLLQQPYMQQTRDPNASLNQQLLNLVDHGSDLRLQLRTVVGQNGGGDDGTRHTTGTSEGSLGRNKDVRHVLVFAQQRQMEKNGQRFSVGSHDDQLGNTTVEGLGGYKRQHRAKTKLGEEQGETRAATHASQRQGE